MVVWPLPSVVISFSAPLAALAPMMTDVDSIDLPRGAPGQYHNARLPERP
jgi:hypothetical protein